MSQQHDPAGDSVPPATASAPPATEYLGYTSIEYLRHLDTLLRQPKRRTYDLMHVGPGQRVLDLGCGPGTDTVPLAQIVGDGGRVFGVDLNADMLMEAERRACEAGVAGWVQHLQADAVALPFEPDTFDATRSERVFQHLADPAAALAEMVRVTKPGGWVVVLDTDWGTLSVDTPEADIERRLVRFQTEVVIRNGRVGRQLYRLFQRQGLEDVAVEGIVGAIHNYALYRMFSMSEVHERGALEAGVLTEDELGRWHDALAQAADKGAFFASLQAFIAAGRKP